MINTDWRSIDFNQAKELDLSKLMLEILSIRQGTFNDFPNLQKLYLRWNQINKIDLNGFQRLENLEELNLGNNKLDKIESNSFQHLKTKVNHTHTQNIPNH